MYVCMYASLTANAKCSPRLIVHPHTYSTHAFPVKEASTQEQCLDACIANSSCVAATWWGKTFRRSDEDWRCQLLDNNTLLRHNYRQHYAVTTYELVELCRNAPGTLNYMQYYVITTETSSQCSVLGSNKLHVTRSL